MYINKGLTITYTNSGTSAIAVDSLLVIDSIVGVAQNTIPAGKSAVVNIEGVYDLPKKTGFGEALTLGAVAYYDPASQKIVNAQDSGKTFVVAGVCMLAAADNAATVRIKINA